MRFLWLGLALTMVGVPVGASAQSEGGGAEQEAEEAPRPEDAEAARGARTHFRRGMEHFRARAFREAIREFKVAADLVPSADLWFNIARAHEELSEYDQAVEYYRRYLRDRVDPPDRAEVEQHIEQLEERAEELREAKRRRPTTGTLRVRSNVVGAAIAVDEERVGSAPLEVPLNLSPGSHPLEVSEEGYVPLRARVRVERGVTTGAYAELEPATQYESVRGTRVWTWIVGGLAVAALGTSIGLGAKAASLENDGNLPDARDWALRSDYVLGAALGLGTVAAILWFVEGRAQGTERVEPAQSGQ